MNFAVLALAAAYLSAGSAGTATITWSSTDSDPVFSIELHHDSFNQDFAIANNVNPAAKSITIDLPQVPAGDGYTLNFVNITDITKVYASSGEFSIAAAASGSATRSTASATGSAGGNWRCFGLCCFVRVHFRVGVWLCFRQRVESLYDPILGLVTSHDRRYRGARRPLGRRVFSLAGDPPARGPRLRRSPPLFDTRF
ncbi:hypothetical protein MKEN_00963800 [Mycena kentingensis (nom. inval.)]|nr:hypothetical protein MKEN_00963800 [Mycena kentingensis (nom. inval.)]